MKQQYCPPPRVRTITPSGSRTRVSGTGGGRSNKERQRLELGGMTKNLYHGIFLNYTGFTVYDGIFFFYA